MPQDSITQQHMESRPETTHLHPSNREKRWGTCRRHRLHWTGTIAGEEEEEGWEDNYTTARKP